MGETTLVFLVFFVTCAVASKTYIVHLRERGTGALGFEERQQWYSSFLPQAAAHEGPASRIMYSYEKVMSGFAARLTEEEVAEMREKDGFLKAYPDTLLHLQTTYSPQYVGLDAGKGLWPKSGFGRGTIIGVLDSGIWPECPSFGAEDIPRAPERWKGICQGGEAFNASHCNNKLIGARFYNRGIAAWGGAGGGGVPARYEDSPRDSDGHGTHTASIAAGSSAGNANLFGNANGTARGTAPLAHIAIYKVCWANRCSSSDVLAAMDDAVADGVDVISVSLGGASAPFHDDSIAIAAFRAAENGVFVSCAAGNGGPFSYSLSNEAPWVTTVGASSLDRDLVGEVRLGSGTVLYGESADPQGKVTESLPLVYERDSCGTDAWLREALNSSHFAGKIVVCDLGDGSRVKQGDVVRLAGGKAMILASTEDRGQTLTADAHVLPTTLLGFEDGAAMKAYINSTQNPTVSLKFDGTVFGISAAPAVAAFSSRGPSSASPWILKPDILAPGVNILAAWPLNLAPSRLSTDERRVRFNIASGTSMAAPHVSGIAALLKSVHPEWSPAAIKSALITTARTLNDRGGSIADGATNAPASLFAMGGGQVNPESAVDPGLVYDLGISDYLPYLCSLEYTDSQIFIITNRNFTCPPRRPSSLSRDHLNYPSFSVIFSSGANSARAISKRTVTNVGPANSTYKVQVIGPDGVRVTVNPRKLSFTAVNEKKSYRVTFVSTAPSSPPDSFAEGYLVWVSSHSNHKVRSPISITWN